MKTLISKAIVGALLLTGANAAMAASSAQLKLTGTITPGSCHVALLGGGELSLGAVPASQLSAVEVNSLPAKTVGYVITCTAPMRVATSWTDESLGASGANEFGLGRQGLNAVGSYTLTHLPDETSTGSGPAFLIKSRDNGQSWTAGNYSIESGANSLFAFAATAGATAPSAFDSYMGKVAIQPSIVPTNSLDVTEVIELDGRASLELRYL